MHDRRAAPPPATHKRVTVCGFGYSCMYTSVCVDSVVFVCLSTQRPEEQQLANGMWGVCMCLYLHVCVFSYLLHRNSEMLQNTRWEDEREEYQKGGLEESGERLNVFSKRKRRNNSGMKEMIIKGYG